MSVDREARSVQREHDNPPTPRVTVGRHPERARYDFASIAKILDDGTICHVGFIADGQPLVMPAIYGRIGERFYFHGSVLARWLKTIASSIPVCVTVSIIDELVLARSAFQHSLNYRSAMILGSAETVIDAQEKLAALQAVSEHVCPGRWADARKPNERELKATIVLRMPIAEASAKVRTGPPKDNDEDMGSGIWAGQVPLLLMRGTPVPDPLLEGGVPTPPYAHSGKYR